MTATQAQTRCTVTESQWSTLRQHVEFDLSTSTPVVGNVTDARSEGEWRVIRNGTEIRRVNRHLRFQWIGRHGDRVQYRYKDSAGNRGQWCGYVFDVGECDRRYEVNSATGLSSGPIYDTVANAMTQAMADTQDGESAEIVLADDQTHAMGTASAYGGDDTLTRRFMFTRSNTGTNRPVMQWSGGSNPGFRTGKRGSFAVLGVDLDGQLASDTDTGHDCFELARASGGSRNAYDVLVEDSNVTNWHDGIAGEDADANAVARDAGTTAFIGFKNVRFEDQEEYHLFGLKYCSRICLLDVFLGDVNWANSSNHQFFRVAHTERVFIDNLSSIDNDDDAVMRFAVDPNTDLASATRYIDISRSTWTNPSAVTFSTQAGAGDGVGYLRHARITGCKFYGGIVKCERNVNSDDNMLNVDQLHIYENPFLSNVELQATDSGGQGSADAIDNVFVEANCHILNDRENVAGLLLLGNDATKFAADAITFRSNICYLTQSGDGFGTPRCMLRAPSLTRADVAARIVAMDNNHLGKVDGFSLFAFNGSDGSANLATWQGATGFDGSSTITSNTTMDFANTGSATLLDRDTRMATGSGPQANAGYSYNDSAVAIDADDFLRPASSPDAGPYEYQASHPTANAPEFNDGDGGRLTWMDAQSGITVELSGVAEHAVLHDGRLLLRPNGNGIRILSWTPEPSLSAFEAVNGGVVGLPGHLKANEYGMDSRLSFGGRRIESLPAKVNRGQVAVLCRSRLVELADQWGNWTPEGYTAENSRSAIESMLCIAVVGHSLDDAKRTLLGAPAFGTSDLSDTLRDMAEASGGLRRARLDMSLLPTTVDLSALATTLSINVREFDELKARLERIFSRFSGDFYSDWNTDTATPGLQHPGYGTFLASCVSQALVLLSSSRYSAEQKRKLATSMSQWGADLLGAMFDNRRMVANGGHCQGRKALTLLFLYLARISQWMQLSTVLEGINESGESQLHEDDRWGQLNWGVAAGNGMTWRWDFNRGRFQGKDQKAENMLPLDPVTWGSSLGSPNPRTWGWLIRSYFPPTIGSEIGTALFFNLIDRGSSWSRSAIAAVSSWMSTQPAALVTALAQSPPDIDFSATTPAWGEDYGYDPKIDGMCAAAWTAHAKVEQNDGAPGDHPGVSNAR